jgi:hypothetical protein
MSAVPAGTGELLWAASIVDSKAKDNNVHFFMQPLTFLGLASTLVYAAPSGKKQSTVGTTGDKGSSILCISKPEIAAEKCVPRTLRLPSSDIIVGFAMLMGNVCEQSAIAAA